MKRFSLPAFLSCLMILLTAVALSAATLTSFSITTAVGAGGKITPASPVKAVQGKKATLTVTADKNYYIDTVTVDGTAEDLSAVDRNKPYKVVITNVQSDHTVNATFKIYPQVTVSISGTGTITPAASPLNVAYGKSTKLTIKAGSKQFINSISVNGVSKNLDGVVRTNPYSLQLNAVVANQAVVVEFLDIADNVKAVPTNIPLGIYSGKYSLHQTKPAPATKTDVPMTAITFNDFAKLNDFAGAMYEVFAANSISSATCTTACGKLLDLTFSCKAACNDKTSAATLNFSFNKSGALGNGNLSGMVYKVNANGGQSPLGGVTIYLDGIAVASTASDGSYSAQNVSGTASSTVKASLTGYTDAVQTGVDVTASANIYLNMQPADPHSRTLWSGSGPYQCPIYLANSSGDTAIRVFDMMLGKDIKVILTSLNGGAKSLPDARKLIGNSAVDYNMTVLGGASISRFNASDNKKYDYDDNEDGFSGAVVPSTTRIQGPYTGDKLIYFSGNDPATDPAEAAALKAMYSLDLYYYAGKEWKKAGKAEVIKTEDGGFFLKPSWNVYMDKLTDFAFVLSEPVSITAHIRGKVTDSFTGNAISGALVSIGDASDTTTPSGDYQIKITLPIKSPAIELFAKMPDYEAYSSTVQILYNPADTEINISKDVALTSTPSTATIKGKIYDIDTKSSVAGADVKLATGTVLSPQSIHIEGGKATVGLDSAATYKWEFSADNATWTTVVSGPGKSSIDLISHLDKFAAANISSGVVSLKVTVAHTNFTESTSGSFYLSLDFNGTGSISATGGSVKVWGGKDKGFYFATLAGADAGTAITYKWESYVNWCKDSNKPDTCKNIIAPVTLSNSSMLAVTSMMSFINTNISALNAIIPGSYPPTSYLAGGATLYVELTAGYTLNGQYTEEKTQNPATFNMSASGAEISNIFLSGNSDVTVLFSTISDSIGDYLYKKIPPSLSGALLLSARADNYLPSETIEAGTFAAGSIVSKDIPLKTPKPMTAVAFNMDTCGANNGWTLAGNSSVVKWQCLANPATYTVPYELVNSMYYPEEGLDANNVEINDPTKVVSLLPPAEGTGYAWFGNSANATFSDKNTNTSSSYFYGSMKSPLIDLAGYTYATLNFATWFEVESVDIQDGNFDQMHLLFRIDPKIPGQPAAVDLLGPDGSIIPVNEDQWYVFGGMNPSNEPPGVYQLGDHNYSSGGINAVPAWLASQFNLNPLVGRKIQLGFYFNSGDNLFNGFRGWGVDDVKVLNINSGLGFNIKPSYDGLPKASSQRGSSAEPVSTPWSLKSPKCKILGNF